MQVIGGAIERIDNPAVLVAAFDYARLFSDDTVAWKGFQQFLDNERLGFPIDIADIIVACFYFDLQVGYFVDFANDKIASAVGRSNRDIEHWLHGGYGVLEKARSLANGPTIDQHKR